MMIELTAQTNDHDRRLDRVLRKALPALPLSALHRLFRTKAVLLNGTPCQPDRRVKAGDRITVRARLPESAPPPVCPATAPEKLIIVLETADLLIVNKPAGVPVHAPDSPFAVSSLNDAVLAYLLPQMPASLSFRPGPLHRLDTGTSGLVAFSKTLAGARAFSAAIAEGRVAKQYLALLDGRVEAEAVWEDALARSGNKTRVAPGGKEAVTRVRPLALSAAGVSPRTLAIVRLETGRTHQIRAQAAAHGHALCGDRKYGGSPLAGGFLLHAFALEFPAPNAAEPPVRVSCPPPPAFQQKVAMLLGSPFPVRSAAGWYRLN